MSLKVFIKKALTHACVYFSIIMLLYIAIAAIMTVNEDRLLLEASRTVLFFVFSLLLACANVVFSLKRISAVLRTVIHYFITLFAFYACLLLPLSLRAASLLIGFAVFTALYAAVMGISAFILSRYRSSAERTEEYSKQFKS